MSSDVLMIVPLFLAVGIGWWLGRFQASQHSGGEPGRQEPGRDYFIGLDHLINDNTDEAIESFIRALEVNSDTIPAHLALAKLFRRKGEVDRAVGIHQTLLARPDLSRDDSLRIQMALARDYEALGLLDRAENLLHDIIRQAPESAVRHRAVKLLVKLYEKEKEWQAALDTALELPVTERTEIERELAHYCCELAERYRCDGNVAAAEHSLRQALSHDASCCRASLLWARLLMAQARWRPAIKSLQQVVLQNARFVSEAVVPMVECHHALGSNDELEQQLRHWLSRAPSASVIMALADRIWQRKDVYAAGTFLTEELKKRPSIKGFNRLIDMHIDYGSRSAKQSLSVLRGLTGQLEQSKPIYQCSHCGFAGRVLHWQCPSCKQWGTTGPIQGLEGE
ncbi:lipopolysaccharide assembly protein LapB [Marinobacterium weihaiense]|uniref:Lipopolysaccharide assembly protein B n=1 Tax=Marinobacterium weihaiense TaxID=2851016 RepID=A0ABS6MAU3_9GAMM|nr:lipopolysaccharide assembly protein LapB [Marinobacterium weihaiense]MBV0933408.1 lipopolysaccharide assembly protein LapB [Marinobacterium weihaiense]